jgi:hypothetical protein
LVLIIVPLSDAGWRIALPGSAAELSSVSSTLAAVNIQGFARHEADCLQVQHRIDDLHVDAWVLPSHAQAARVAEGSQEIRVGG